MEKAIIKKNLVHKFEEKIQLEYAVKEGFDFARGLSKKQSEEFLENKDHESGLPEDYKFWTFHGTPGFLQLNMEGKWNGESFDDRRIECFDPYTGERLPQRYGFHLLAENPYEKINIPNDMIKYASF